MKKKLLPYLENVAESGAACLVTMVQGNVLLLALTHWVTAAQTGFLAGTAATAAIALTKTESRLVLAGILGLSTAIVDYFVHPGMIGEHHITEAIVTGVGAAVLSYAVATIIAAYRARRPREAAELDEPVRDVVDGE
ncbi:MAG: hypothetical protein QNI99_16610 [Woeseiaceae bacterium]|nr:hypothetical protein [Woeseiaceae bacterium]